MDTQLLERLTSRVTDVLNQPHLNLDYLQYIVNQEAFILTAALSTLKIHAAVSQESPCAFIRAGG